MNKFLHAIQYKILYFHSNFFPLAFQGVKKPVWYTVSVRNFCSPIIPSINFCSPVIPSINKAAIHVSDFCLEQSLIQENLWNKFGAKPKTGWKGDEGVEQRSQGCRAKKSESVCLYQLWDVLLCLCTSAVHSLIKWTNPHWKENMLPHSIFHSKICYHIA